jgi:hypothetical protein
VSPVGRKLVVSNIVYVDSPGQLTARPADDQMERMRRKKMPIEDNFHSCRSYRCFHPCIYRHIHMNEYSHLRRHVYLVWLWHRNCMGRRQDVESVGHNRWSL